jgi:DNA-binding GntR family transcriptional regulator
MNRRPLRSDIQSLIAGRIVSADLAAGARVRDTEVAQQLGVSRTPVREALIRLEKQGLIDSDPGRGFRVRHLSAIEANETYPILWTLEGLALRSSAPISAIAAQSLNRLAAAIAAAKSPSRRIDLDDQWHTLLLAGSHNERLLSMIGELKDVVRRYELRYMESEPLVRASAADHAAIVRAARTDTGKASALLEKHWRVALRSLLRRIAGESQ